MELNYDWTYQEWDNTMVEPIKDECGDGQEIIHGIYQG